MEQIIFEEMIVSQNVKKLLVFHLTNGFIIVFILVRN
jgi:hypothetical protein